MTGLVILVLQKTFHHTPASSSGKRSLKRQVSSSGLSLQLVFSSSMVSSSLTSRDSQGATETEGLWGNQATMNHEQPRQPLAQQLTRFPLEVKGPRLGKSNHSNHLLTVNDQILKVKHHVTIDPKTKQTFLAKGVGTSGVTLRVNLFTKATQIGVSQTGEPQEWLVY